MYISGPLLREANSQAATPTFGEILYFGTRLLLKLSGVLHLLLTLLFIKDRYLETRCAVPLLSHVLCTSMYNRDTVLGMLLVL